MKGDVIMELKPFVFQPQAEREEVLKQLSKTMPVFKKKTITCKRMKPTNFLQSYRIFLL